MKRPIMDRRLMENFNWPLLLSMFALSFCGLVNLYSISESNSVTGWNWFVRQSGFFGLGFGLMIFLMLFDYQHLKKVAMPMYVISLILLVAVRFVGVKAGGATRWLDLSVIRFQPSELIKLVVVVVLAIYFSRKDYHDGLGFKDFIPPMLLVLVPFGLILKQPDLGTAIHIALTSAPMFLFVRLQIQVILGIVISSLSMIVWLALGGWTWLLSNHFIKPYHIDRIQSYINPENDPTNNGWQIIQAKSAIGSGQIMGRGFMAGSQQKYGFLPAPETDFAFAALAEEWGFLGATVVLVLFFCLLWSALSVIKRSKDRFGSYLVLGLSSLIFWQMTINVAMVTGLFPVVGIPLPLISYGGTSMLMTILSISVILNVGMRRFLFQDDPVKQNPKVWQEGIVEPKEPTVFPVRRLAALDPNEPELHPAHRLPHCKPWLKYLNRRRIDI